MPTTQADAVNQPQRAFVTRSEPALPSPVIAPDAALGARSIVIADTLEWIGRRLDVPEGHEFLFCRAHEIGWSCNGVSTGLSAHILRREENIADPNQVFVEIKIHLREPTPRATLWVERGSRWAFHPCLLRARDHFPAADTYMGLANAVVFIIGNALRNPQAPEYPLTR